MRDEIRDVFVNGHRLEGGIYTAVEEWCLERTAAKKKYGPIASWDTSEITNMDGLFLTKVAFDDDISRWNMSSVESRRYMFLGATSIPLNRRPGGVPY